MKNQQNKKEQPIKQKIDHQPVSNKIKSDKKTQSKVKPSKKHQSVFNQEFKNSYPKLSKIPLLNRVVFWMYSEGWFYSTTVIIVWLLFLIFGLNHLGKFIITDEPPWLYERIPRYWNSLFAGDLAQTLPTRNPGVTQSLLSGITYLLLDLNDYTSANIDTYLYLWRLPILLFNLLCIIIAYFLLKKLFDKAHALIITGFVAFTPILLGMSQIVNSDSALWSTSFISVIAFLVYLKIPKRKYIWVSGIFMGLALLSKFTATPLYIFLFMYLSLGYLYKPYDKQQFISRTKGLLGIFGISLGVVYVLIPAAWFNLKVLFASTIYPPLLEKTYGMLPLLLLMVVVYLEIFLLKAKASEFIRSKMNVSLVLLFALSAFFLFAFAFVELNSQFTFYSHGKTTISSSGFGTAEFLPNFEGSFYTALRNLTIPVLLSVMIFFVASFFNPIRKK